MTCSTLRSQRFTPRLALLVLSIATLTHQPSSAASPASELKSQGADPIVDLLVAPERSGITVRYIAVSEAAGNLIIENNSDERQTVRLPKAFAAIPVAGNERFLAQIGLFGGQNGGGQNGGQNFGGQNNGGQNNGGQSQNVGGNAGQNPGGGGPNGGLFDGGLMRIGAGKTIRRQTVTVCLNHGLASPTAKMPYRIVPLETVVSDPVTRRLCADVGSDQLSVDVAQAAAWHHENGLSIAELAALDKRRSRYTGIVRMFSTDDLRAAELYVAGLISTLHPNSQSQSEPAAPQSESTP